QRFMVEPILANDPQHQENLTPSLSGNGAPRAYKRCKWPTVWTNNSSHFNRFKWSSSAHQTKSRKGTISDSPWRSNTTNPPARIRKSPDEEDSYSRAASNR